tara:strand:- start:5578 stop:5949 length:372 start_codon:yes stop_codon:yes gene_type:complete
MEKKGLTKMIVPLIEEGVKKADTSLKDPPTPKNCMYLIHTEYKKEKVALDKNMLTTIRARLIHANTKHPEGANFQNLIDEIVEVESEYDKKGSSDYSHENYVYELYDVITVAIRMIEQAEKGD